MEKHELAFEDYKNGMKQKEIAKKYGTTINTVKSWSRRYEWSKKKKKGAPQNKSVHTKKECKKIAEEIVEISELDEEHQLFCIYYLKYHNKVKAYQKVKPNTSYNSACVMASRWSKQPAVIEELNRLKKELYEDALLDPHDIVQKYIDIAYAKSKRLEKLIEDLFGFTKMNYGKVAMHVSKVDIVKLLSQLLEEFYPSFKDKNLSYELQSNVPGKVITADGNLLARLFDNLINNAIKYGADG